MQTFDTSSGSSGSSFDASDAAFLQARLRLFGRLGGVCSLCFTVAYGLTYGLDPERGWGAWFDTNNSYLDPLVALAFFALWFVCRGGTQSRSFLAGVDLVGFVAIFMLVVWVLVISDFTLHPVSSTLFATTLMIFRAVVVPSNRQRTMLACSIGTLLGGSAILTPATHPSVVFTDPSLRIGLFAWVLVGALVSIVMSKTLYGLRKAVKDAQSLGQYKLEERIGEGGMGVVYRACHAMLRRPTAVKIIRPDAVNESSICRFEREVQLTAGLSHPNTIAIFDYGRSTDGVFYYAMEHLEGVTLQELVDRFGPQAPERVASILLQVCGSLAEAHEHGMVHRDIKPANIFLTRKGGIPDVVKVMDFGLVHTDHDPEDEPATADGERFTGTPGYVAPEAIQPDASVTPAADLYAVGAVGFFLLTGRGVFEGESGIEILTQQVTRPAPRPSEVRAEIEAPELESILLRCLERTPGERFPSAGELGEALEELARSWMRRDASTWWTAHAPEIDTIRACGEPAPSTDGGAPEVLVSQVAEGDGQR